MQTYNHRIIQRRRYTGKLFSRYYTHIHTNEKRNELTELCKYNGR